QVQGLADTVEKAKGVIDNVHQLKTMLDKGDLAGALGLVLEKTGHEDIAKRVDSVNKAIHGADAIKAALDGKSYTTAIQAALEMASNVQQGLGNGRPPGSEAFKTAEAISAQAVGLENAIKSRDPAQIAAAALRLKATVSNARAGLYDLTSDKSTDSAKNALRTADAIQALDEGIKYAAQGNLPLAAASFMEAVSQSRQRGASNQAHNQATQKLLEAVKAGLTLAGQNKSLGEVLKAVAPMIHDALELKKHEQAIGVEVPSLPDDPDATDSEDD
ncbi:MAG TPA: hypothetical protein VND93_21985, partial [Myxococcales bacterium]|nr:hypothetical protein [Myxococcales bacterium]